MANVEGVNSTSSDKTGAAFSSVAIFGIVTSVYIAIIVVYYSCKFVQLMRTPELRKEGTTKCKKIKSCLKTYGNGILIALGGLFYFFGDNFSPIVIKYAEELHCDQHCIFRTQTAGIIVLGLATVTYLPILIDPQVPNAKQNNMIPATLLLVPKITNLDLVYTAIERVASDDCDKVMIGSWVYWGIYIFVFTVTSVTQSCVSHRKKKEKDPGPIPVKHAHPVRYMYTKKTEKIEEIEETEEIDEQTLLLQTGERSQSKQICCGIIQGVLISLFAASYILADNRLPLACTCSARDISFRNKVWVGLWAFAFANLAVFGVRYMCKKW